MSEIGESKISPRFPRTIAEMGPWDFQAAFDSLGLTDEDQAALDDGIPTPEQIALLQVLSQMARHALLSADIGQPFGKPS